MKFDEMDYIEIHQLLEEKIATLEDTDEYKKSLRQALSALEAIGTY